MTIAIEDKIKLLDECGMKDAAKKIRADIEMKAEAKRLSEMKLVPITVNEIEKKICGYYWDIDGFLDGGLAGNIVLLTGLLGMGASLVRLAGSKMPFAVVIGSLLGCAVASAFAFRRKSLLANMDLGRWTDPIPYGGLLAVKEAKERGLSDFKIYYPVTKEKARLLKDPVITGMSGARYVQEPCKAEMSLWSPSYRGLGICPKGPHSHEEKVAYGLMVEVFAWDDGKVYE